MSIFARAHYTSEVTNFIDQLKTKKPELAQAQLAGRALLWDKAIDRQTQQDIAAGQLQQKPYVYQTNADQH